jgi:hypothetical protein
VSSTRFSGEILMKLEFSGQIFGKCANIAFHENPSSGSRVVLCGRTGGHTDLSKLIVTFLNFTTAPDNNRSLPRVCPSATSPE